MSSDPDMQHFGVPGEPGAPGTARIRRAHAALAAAEALQPTLQGTHAKVNFDLMAALREALPKYTVLEAIKDAGSRVAAKDLPTFAAAQQWIADNDPAARRIFEIRVQRA